MDKTIHYLTDILIDELTAAINEKEDFHSYLQAHIFYLILNTWRLPDEELFHDSYRPVREELNEMIIRLRTEISRLNAKNIIE